jgi:hypothetical protein
MDLHTLEAHVGGVTALAVTPDSQHVISAGLMSLRSPYIPSLGPEFFVPRWTLMMFDVASGNFDLTAARFSFI